MSDIEDTKFKVERHDVRIGMLEGLWRDDIKPALSSLVKVNEEQTVQIAKMNTRQEVSNKYFWFMFGLVATAIIGAVVERLVN